ncbi:MAG TPA: DUF3048 domain-containing protein [Patescibacteria group bacterium]|nr:DUF3048 domain-containing protein [Patescibacteria group bacterium]
MKKSFFSSKIFMVLVSFLGLYLLSAGASLAIFSYLKGGPSLDIGGNGLKDTRSKINLDMPKTEECPINGGMFTKAEKSIWSERRPVAAMIENHADSRPPSGLSKADVVYEAVSEGGITRFLSIFYCGAAAEDVKIAPVRSARIYFINLAAGYGDKPIFMHVGGANDYGGTGETVKDARALELLETIGWRAPKGNDFDTTYDSAFPVFWRNYDRLDHTVATEHTMMASLDAAYEEAAKRGLGAKDSKGNLWNKNFTPWKFSDEKPSSNPSATQISFEFWSNKPDYNVIWKYDSKTNSYLRENGGKAYIDLETKTQLSAKNVIILFSKEKGPVDKNLHMLYTVIGTGKALVFQNGVAIEGSWEKTAINDMIVFKDNSGKEISFMRGNTWVEVVPSGNTIDY